MSRITPSDQDMRSRTALAVFVGCFLALAILKVAAIDEPPAWDASFSVFPAAEALVDANFDYGQVLAAPGYADGGPNVHTLSIVTLVTAVSVFIFGEPHTLFPVLHVVHLAIAAAAAAGLYRLGAHMLDRRSAIAAAVAALTMPVVITQAGMMYLEMPLLAATVWAAVAWLEGRLGTAVALATVAVAVKQPGLATAGGLALATLIDPIRERRKPRFAAMMLAFPLAVVFLDLVTRGDAVPVRTASVAQFDFAVTQSARFSARLPDLLLILALYLVTRPFISSRPLRDDDELTIGVQRFEVLVGSLTVAFLGFYAATAWLGVVVLPRYWVQIVPFLIVALIVALRRFADRNIAFVTSLLIAGLFLANIAGAFYPPAGQNNFPLTERSGEYAPLLDLHRRSAAAIAQLPDDVPVYYSLADHYRVTYPASGYVQTPVANGVNVLTIPTERRSDITTYPNDFYVVADQARLGGGALASVWSSAEASPDYTTAAAALVSGEFTVSIVRVTRNP